MRKREFLNKLKQGLQEMSKSEIEAILGYYEEMIHDAVDSGENEEGFISRLGTVGEIVSTIENDNEFVAMIKEKHGKGWKGAISATAKAIGMFIVVIMSITVVSVAIGLIGGGMGFAVIAVVRIIGFDSTVSTYLVLMRVANIVFGIGLAVLAIGLCNWYFQNIRSAFKYLTGKLDGYLNKGGKTNE